MEPSPNGYIYEALQHPRQERFGREGEVVRGGGQGLCSETVSVLEATPMQPKPTGWPKHEPNKNNGNKVDVGETTALSPPQRATGS